MWPKLNFVVLIPSGMYRENQETLHSLQQGNMVVSASWFVPTRRLPKAHHWNNKGVTSAQLRDCSWPAQPEPRPKANWAPLERSESGCAATFAFQPDWAGEDLQGRVEEDPQIQVWQCCCIISKKTHGFTSSEGSFYSTLSWIFMTTCYSVFLFYTFTEIEIYETIFLSKQGSQCTL